LETSRSKVALDQDDSPVLLMRNAWEFEDFVKGWPEVEFAAVRERN
jgi:peptide subunit release factor RF-3